MVKLDLNRKLQVVAVACIVIVLSASAITLYDSQRALTAKDFPLEVDLNRSVFYVGENITFTASVINRSGRDVNTTSNGFQPAAWFYNINDTPILVEPSSLAFRYLKPNEQISRTYDFKTTEPGTYILYVRYHIGVNNVELTNQLANITIEVR
jgi:hypothetical protein